MAGTPTSTATRRCPAPPALASDAAPITVTASARRSNTLAGNNTCVRRPPGTEPAAAAADRPQTVAERLGHANAMTVIQTYAHELVNQEDRTRKAIDSAFVTGHGRIERTGE